VLFHPIFYSTRHNSSGAT